MMNQTIELPLSELVADTQYQPRYGGENGLNPEHLEHLACSDVTDWPPVLVTPVLDKQGEVEYKIIDGFHRYEVAKQKKLQTLRCTVVANADYETAFAANLKNGLPLSDKDREEFALYLHDQYPNLSQYDIARRVGVSQSTVSRYFKQASNAGESSANNGATSKTQADAFKKMFRLIYQARTERTGVNTFAQFFSGKNDAQQQAEYIKSCLEQYEGDEQDTMAQDALVIGQALVDGATLLLSKKHKKNEPA